MAKWRIVGSRGFLPYKVQNKGGWWPFWITQVDCVSRTDAEQALKFLKEHYNG